jgi:hypothetical protein
MKKILSFFKILTLSFVMILGFSNTLSAQYTGTGEFTKITALQDLSDGYYVIAYGSTFAMNNTHNGTFFEHTGISPVSDVITDPSDAMVWKIETNGSYKTIYNEGTDVYVSYTGSGNNVQATNPDPLTNAEMWTFTYELNLFRIQSVNVAGRYLQYNTGSPRFACYTGSQQHITLYQLTPPETCAILEGFEENVWATGGGNYNNRTVTDSYGPWSVSAMTTMTAGSDRYNGLRSARFRGNTGDTGPTLHKVEMAFDHYGIKKVSFEYASWAGHSGGIINLESSIDQGATWTNVGAPITVNSWATDGWQTANFDVNITGNARIRITKNPQSGSTSVNIDDICIIDYGESNIVKNPTFTPGSGFFDKPINVTIECTTEDAIIYYTTDGTTPTPSSTLYTTPIPLTTSGTFAVKAMAVKDGMDDSDVTTANYTIHIYDTFVCDFLEDFEDLLDGAGAYGGADVTFASGIWRVVGYTTMDDNDRRNGEGSVRLRGNASDSCHLTMKFDKPNGLGTLKFRYGSYGTHQNGQISAYYSTDQGANWTLIESFNAISWIAGGNILQEKEYTLNIPGDIRIKIARDGTTAGTSSVNIDDICISDFTGTPTVALPTFSPPGGNVIEPLNVTITCTTADADIHYTLDGTDPTTASPIYITPIPVNATTTIKAMGVNASMNNSPIATATYTFPTPVPNIAAFKAANTPTATPDVYKITGDVTFVFRSGRNVYVKDATAGLLIYDFNTPVITNIYNNGDVISGGIIGTYTNYSGLHELIPSVNPAAGIPGTPVEPTILTIEDLLANFEQYESQLVKLEEVTFANGTFGTGGGANINITQNTSEMICRNHYNTFTGYTTYSNSRYDVAGFAIPFNTDRQIAPRDSIDDIKRLEFLISLSATAGGTVSGAGTFFYGDDITVSATANTGYHFVNWTEGGTEVSTNANYSFTVTEARTLVANFEINTYTITVSSTAGGSATGGGNYTHGQTVTLNATANTGYEFLYWLEGGTQITDNPYTFEATANRTLVATFALKSYLIAVSANPPEGGTPSGGGTYNHFSTATLNANPDIAYNFINWTEGSTVVGTNQIYSFEVTGPRTLVANFEMKTFNITATAGTGGTIYPSGIHTTNYGSTPTFTITPDPGYHILNIFIDNYPVNYTVTPEDSDPFDYIFDPVYAAHTIHATFALNCYALNPNNVIGPGATISMSPAGCVQHGNAVTFNITTDCYQISQILIGGVNQGINSGYSYSYTIPNVTGKLPLIVVNTLIDQYSITATPINDPNGKIIPSGVEWVNCGGSMTYNFETNFGYRVKTLLIDGVSVPVPVTHSYTFNNVRKNSTIHIEIEEYPQVIIQFGPSATQGLGGVVFPTYSPTAVNFIAVDSGTVAYPFSIVPDIGYMIEYVYVDGVSQPAAAQTGTYVFDYLHINHTIFATFKPIMFTISATAVNGLITPSGQVPVEYGSTPTFNTYPNDGYHLNTILVDGVPQPGSSYTFAPVTANHTITALFDVNTYTIVATSGPNGDISPEGAQIVEHGSNKTFYFYPVEGYQVDKVMVNGLLDPAAAVDGFFTFTNINQGHTIHVTFTIKTFTITTTFSPGGEVLPSGVATIEYNAHSEIYVFHSDPGFIVKYVYVDGVNIPLAVQNKEHRFLNVKANHTLYVVFAPDHFTITATATQGGDINPDGEVVVPNGADKTFYFSPDVGYKLVRVLIDGTNEPEAVIAGFFTFTDLSNDHSITAQFEKMMYEIILPDPNLGAIAIPVGGSDSPVEYGAQFNFVVELLEGYTQSDITVRTNGMVLHPVNTIFTINNITVDQYVTVDGLALNTYTVTAKGSTGGTINPAGIFMVTHGESKTFEMIPNVGYKVSDVVVNGESEGAVEVYTFHNVRADGTINAFFQYTGVGIIDPISLINVYSNHNVVTIENKDLLPIRQVEIMDMLGRTLWTGLANGDRTDITLSVAKGIYAVRIITDDGNQIVAKVNIY